ncbi:hypothetical protein [Blastococcus sp. CT_GayMR16]|uniref:hypothetical protein n=1 Tax=Blastococcus sp. CT_GayMR16 TaxID=2559607 RepID=UPI0010740F10|nr:hypothetical protein [Blastococcus sp. CT_GayMR16]TFV83124.1 hypothetical protein E4P38_20940 [Blastococcus sp. CT_GayMR16]
MTAPTPADVSAARVVYLSSAQRVWWSPLLPPAEGEALHDAVTHAVAGIGDASGLVSFECADGRLVWIRARVLESIELRNATVAPINPDQRYRPVVLELEALTAEEIADRVVRP